MFKKHTWKILVIVLASLSIGYLVGSYQASQAFLTNDRGEVEIDKVLNLYSRSRTDAVNFNQYWTVWDKIKSKYAGEVDETKLFYGSLKGMVNALDDPHSVYMPPTDAEDFAQDLSGEFSGIGAEIGIRDNRLTVVAPLEDSPAKNAGLKAGDKVMAINGEDTTGITTEEAVNKIRGKKGTEVTLTVIHEGRKETEDITITRDKINIPTIKWEMKENDIAHLRIRYFNQNTWSQFDEAVKEILADSPRGIVLDLRHNPGGFLKTSVDIASEWVEEGVIVSEGVDGNIKEKFRTTGEHRLAGIPTVVLVDEGTASGSEIVAGALQDHNLATVIGKQTYGKGSVQDFEVLSDGSGLKLTVAKWYTPDGSLIQGEGVKPDVILEELYKEVENKSGEITEVEDVGLQKAIEELKSKISEQN